MFGSQLLVVAYSIRLFYNDIARYFDLLVKSQKAAKKIVERE